MSLLLRKYFESLFKFLQYFIVNLEQQAFLKAKSYLTVARQYYEFILMIFKITCSTILFLIHVEKLQ